MTTTVQQDSVQTIDSVPTAAVQIEQAPEQAKATIQPVPYKRFEEQLAVLPDSISTPIKKQLQLMPDSTVLEIEENGHGATILYKTNAQAREANARQDSLANSNGEHALPIAKSRLGNEYLNEEGAPEHFTIGKLIEFQATGLIVVMVVIVGLCILTYLMNFLLAKFVLGKLVKPQAPVEAKPAIPVPAPLAPAKCTLDPNAPSVHPGFTNKQLQAFLSIAAISALDVHPGLTNEQLAVIFAVAAAEVLGGPCTVVKFKPQNATEWTWTSQGRAELNSNGL
ncbi:MAG: hypothetical protein M0P13_07175 [Fibrobacteraceae bacterium]|nr:hypothetical protein [Fibrobacteraceae bacterium]